MCPIPKYVDVLFLVVAAIMSSIILGTYILALL
jgi:hypothetical protein